MNQPHLLFVYNAGSGLFSTLTGWAHKIVSPATYPCSLCQLTFGNFAMKQEWRNFLNDLPGNKTFLHRDEFQKQYGTGTALPAVFYLQENKPVGLLAASQIAACQTLPELQKALLQQLATLSL